MASSKTSAKKAAETRRKKAAESRARRQIWAVVLFAVGLLLCALAFLQGDNLWLTLHDTLYGILGFSAVLIGPLFIYIAIMATLDKPMGSIGGKVWQSAVLVLLISSAIQIFAGPLEESGLWGSIVRLFQDGVMLEGGGLISGLVGVPLMACFGQTAAKVVILLLIFVFVMIFTGGTLIGLFRGAAKPVKKIGETYTQRVVEREMEAPEKVPTPVPGGRFNVDIPLDGDPPRPSKARKDKPIPPPAPEPEVEMPAQPENEEKEPAGDLPLGTPEGSFAWRSIENPVYSPKDALFSAARGEGHFAFDIPLDTPAETETDAAVGAVDQEEILEQLPEEPDLVDIGEPLLHFRTPPSPPEHKPVRPQTTDEVIDEILRRSALGVPPAGKRAETSDVPAPFQRVADPVEEKLDAGIDEAVKEARERALHAASSFSTPQAASAAAGLGSASDSLASVQPQAGGEEGKTPRQGYAFPPLALLSQPPQRQGEDSAEELKQNAQRLVDTLKSFGVQTRIVDIAKGPAVTRYELQPSAGVKISKITSLADDIALNLAAAGVRIEAPIPNKPAVGIEVPNRNISTVHIREIIDSPEFSSAKSPLTMALGRDIAGRVTVADIAKMPHMLIAGATGSGKSVCINSIIISLLYKSPPDKVKLLMVDPKVVELGVYNGIPHLLVPVVTDPKKAAGALAWAVNEMLSRYRAFADNSVRDISGYNRLCQNREDLRPMPQIVIIIDELADLMMAAPNEVEDYICRLAQMARAAGMHLIIATQRPSVDVITGVIKANIPSRIAFAVSSTVDSRTILDQGGAEKLLGRGDMLFYPVGTSKPLRVQGCFVTDTEVESVVDFIKRGGEEAEYDEEIIQEIERQAVAEKSKDASSGGGFDEEDDMLPAAIECVVEMGMASTSMLQRKLKLGYARAARLIDMLEEKGVVGPFEGSKPRQVLITREQYYEMKMNHEE